MGRSRDIQLFLDHLGHVQTPKGLEQTLAEIARDMGFDGITMYQHVDLANVVASYRHMQQGELIGITTAPVAWSEYYRDNNYVRIDPRVLACRRTVSPFRFRDVGKIIQITPAQRLVFEGQMRAGLGEGFTIPFHFPGEPSGSCTFSVSRRRSLSSRNLPMAHWIGSFAYQAARTMLLNSRRKRRPTEQPHLTERQLQCTVLVARGLNDGEIAKRLGISTETVKKHLKNARISYDVSKSVELVTHSLRDGHITLRDIFSERAP